MRILMLTQKFDGGGVTTVALKLGEALRMLGNEITFVSSSCKEYGRIGSCIALRNLSYIRPYNALAVYNLLSKHVCNVISSEKPDVIIAHTGWFAAPLVNCKIEIPVFIVVHGTYVNELKYVKYHPIQGLEKLRYELGIKEVIKLIYC
ncbi:MAG: glycosyltransferase family 4 protein [Ignisphaera sp.]